MPQMSPMMWFIFPWFLVSMIVFKVVVMSEELKMDVVESEAVRGSKFSLW